MTAQPLTSRGAGAGESQQVLRDEIPGEASDGLLNGAMPVETGPAFGMPSGEVHPSRSMTRWCVRPDQAVEEPSPWRSAGRWLASPPTNRSCSTLWLRSCRCCAKVSAAPRTLAMVGPDPDPAGGPARTHYGLWQPRRRSPPAGSRSATCWRPLVLTPMPFERSTCWFSSLVRLCQGRRPRPCWRRSGSSSAAPGCTQLAPAARRNFSLSSAGSLRG